MFKFISVKFFTFLKDAKIIVCASVVALFGDDLRIGIWQVLDFKDVF